MKFSVTWYVPSAFGVVPASKTRIYVSLAQSGPHVPESGDPLLMGPKWTESCPAITVAGVAARARIDTARDSQRFMGSSHYRSPTPDTTPKNAAAPANSVTHPSDL